MHRRLMNRRRRAVQAESSGSSSYKDTDCVVSHVDNHSSETSEAPLSRAFSLDKHGYKSSTPIDELTQEKHGFTYLVCPGNKRFCFACEHRVFHSDCVVIAVDGFCPNNGKPGGNVFSSAGVYLGEDNDLNGGYTLVDKGATNQTAELHAGIKGLEAALKIDAEELEGNALREVVIKTDSKYVYDGITENIFKWKANGWMTSAKKPVANQEIWKKLDKLVADVEREGINVSFWWVPRRYNEEADRLAEYGLSEVVRCGIEEMVDEMCGGDLLLRHLKVQEMIKKYPELCSG